MCEGFNEVTQENAWHHALLVHSLCSINSSLTLISLTLVSSALSRKALRSFLRCSMAREVGPVGHLSTCPVLGTAARLCSGLSRGYFPALASFLYSLCGISQGYFLPADFFYVSTVSCILSQILLPTMQSRDHCTHLTDERLGLCRFRGMASIHTGGKCW